MKYQQVKEHILRKYKDGAKMATFLVSALDRPGIISSETRDSIYDVLNMPICTGVVLGQLAKTKSELSDLMSERPLRDLRAERANLLNRVEVKPIKVKPIEDELNVVIERTNLEDEPIAEYLIRGPYDLDSLSNDGCKEQLVMSDLYELRSENYSGFNRLKLINIRFPGFSKEIAVVSSKSEANKRLYNEAKKLAIKNAALYDVPLIDKTKQ